jgi:hypothetical protein
MENLVKRYRIILMAIMAIALAIGVSAVPGQTNAMSHQPANLLLLKDTKFYNSDTTKAKPAGILKARQFVNVVATDLKSGSLDPIRWFLIQTTHGHKWIKADQPNQLTQLAGTYAITERTVTAVIPFDLHDSPGTLPSSFGTQPQKLHVTATFNRYPVEFSDVMEFNGNVGMWYLIDTPRGKKWIVDPLLLENVKEHPVSYAMKLTASETAYPYPFVVKSTVDTLDPQVVQVTATWYDSYGPWGTQWYKVQLPQGDRWIAPKNPTLKDYRELTESIILQTETRYFDNPPENVGYGSPQNWLQPGTYQAFEASADWVHIRTDNGDCWVNPKRALLERPEGILQSDEKVDLMKDSRYFRYPLTGEITHTKGFYKPQTVQAFEKWQADDGSIYYHFHGLGGDEWVQVASIVTKPTKQPPTAINRPFKHVAINPRQVDGHDFSRIKKGKCPRVIDSKDNQS